MSGGRDSALPGIARAAIASALGGPRSAPPSAPALAEPRGVFVTLRRRDGGELRGCVGVVEPRFALGEAIRHAAVAAATEDGRFDPVRLDELAGLGPLRPARADEVEVGRHGVVIRCAGRSALLLPEVAPEQGWDRDTLLDHLSLKARLPPDAWRSPGCQLFVFETESFSD